MSDSGIFKVAVKLAPGERAAFLNRACDGQDALRREIESLLRAHDAPDSYLADQPVKLAGTVDAEPITERPGSVIGPYKLLEQIGEGGFGLVFVAEQHHPVRRKVALKIIKPGMDTRDIIARFEAERQALALMDHPNIARVLDAGATESGRPFFVMELVKGIPIIDYSDQQQLTARERLELFVSVCQAVQHAHAKGIIHRDLKPTNILVAPHDGVPVVKVIDFGIAKAIGQQLTEKTIYTGFAQMIGTPLYMSPEQAEINSLDVDIRSDIYSLGVLLYELLTGTTPFDRKRFATAAYDEIRRIIRDEEPPRPSTRLSTLGDTLPIISSRRKMEPARLSALIKGDLDLIVMKALEKDRGRRYDTASAFAADVRRFLNEEPIEARPASALYRFRKFARRNKVALVPAAIIAAALILGTTISTWQAVRATRAEQLATARLSEVQQANAQTTAALQQAELAKQNAEAVSRYLLGVFQAPKSDSEFQTSSSATDFLDRAVAKLDSEFAGEPQLKADVLIALGKLYLSAGSPHKAKEPIEKALAIREQALGPEHPETLRARYEVGAVLQTDGNFDFPRSVTILEELIPLAKAKFGPEHPDTVAALFHLAQGYAHMYRYDKCIPLFDEVLRIRTATLGRDNRETLACLRWLGEAYYRLDKPHSAIPFWQHALEVEQRIMPGDPECHSSDYVLAQAYLVTGQYDRAVPLLEAKVERQQAKYGTDQEGSLSYKSWLAEAYLQANRLDDAERLSRELIAARKSIRRVEGESWRNDQWIDNDLARLGDCLIKQHRGTEAQAVLIEALELQNQRGESSERFYATSLLGGSFLSQQKYTEAEPLLLKGYEGLRNRKTSLASHQRYRLPQALERLVQLYEKTGRPEDAAKWRAEQTSLR